MSDVMAMPIGVLEKMPRPYAHGLDLDFLLRVMQEEFLPVTEVVTHFMSYLREVPAEPVLEELEKELLKREA